MSALPRSSGGASDRPDDPLDQAIAWKLELTSGEAPPAREAAFRAWLNADAAHREAWRRLEQMDATLAHLDAPARTVLARRRNDRSVSRKLRQAALCLLLVAGGLTALNRYHPLSALTADHATATAVTSQVILPDGSRLILDARSAVDVVFSDNERLVQLRQGTILVETAPDPEQRPFIVASRHGRLLALGTRFQVEDTPEGTRLTVLEHRVQANAVQPSRQAIVMADQRLFISPGQPFQVTAAPRDADAWIDGMLVVNDAPLAEVIRVLARYRYGHLGMDPAVAGLRVSGTFSLRDTDRSLRALSAQLPIQLRRYSDLWVQIVPAS